MKKIMRLKQGEVAAIEWLDAVSQDPWHEQSDIDLKPALIKSVGTVFEHTLTHITLAANYDSENDSYSCMICVPNGMVQNIKRLK